VLSYHRNKAKWIISNSKLTSDGDDISVGSQVAHPLDAIKTAGQQFSIKELTDFSGVFEGEMPNTKKQSRKRKKPKLLTLKVVEPDYRGECKDEVLPGSGSFTKKKMIEVGLELPDDNPCKPIAGPWGNDAGMDYKTFNECRQREIDREWGAAKRDYAHFWVDQAVDLGMHITNTLCAGTPSLEAAPVGIGIQINTGDLCKGIADHVGALIKLPQDITFASLTYANEKTGYDDCESTMAGFDRVFCDLHCIRDAVKAGDQAILSTLEKSVHVMGRNMDMLLDYHTGAAKDEILTAIDSLGGESVLDRAHETKKQLLGTFAQMRALLMSSNLASAGHTTATRALNRFVR